ncbi:hypothetical protein EDB84DRAFT_1518729 [Lactarius hengduanensis]|nr:hypothetical protein EDB84DRAFT_1518729 [Lactarius hengduanensis]
MRSLTFPCRMAAASARFVVRASAFFPLSASPVPFQFLAYRRGLLALIQGLILPGIVRNALMEAQAHSLTIAAQLRYATTLCTPLHTHVCAVHVIFFVRSYTPQQYYRFPIHASGTPLGVPLSFAEFPLTTGTWTIDELQICEMRTGLYVVYVAGLHLRPEHMWQISDKRRSRTKKKTALGKGMEMIDMSEMAVRLSRNCGTHSHTNSECQEVSCKFSINYGSCRYWSQMPLTWYSDRSCDSPVNVVHWQRLFESYKFQ